MASTKIPQPEQLHGEVFHPSPEIIEQANVRDPEAVRREAGKDLQSYWARRAGELEWFKPWDKVLDDS
ncbi:MAG TPA: acetyl-coenzyme A synthetase N-terminal domain-containing protein, partial [Bacteroidota bacterium]|nr:acetyl-coenzyme A synthetase N-terminal domain-containing protein [Bacteroidota bacterium]